MAGCRTSRTRRRARLATDGVGHLVVTEISRTGPSGASSDQIPGSATHARRQPAARVIHSVDEGRRLIPRDLFDSKVQYEIPSFQRPYVWNEEDQWAPLWADIRRVACASSPRARYAEALDGVSAHFLGAVVMKEVSAHAGDVARHAVIDGQQRMTTLQILLDAAHAAVAELAATRTKPRLWRSSIINAGNRFAGTRPLQAVALPRRPRRIRSCDGRRPVTVPRASDYRSPHVFRREVRVDQWSDS